MQRLLTPGKLLAALAVLAVATAVVLFVLPDRGTYLFLPDEPHAVEPRITVEDGREPDDRGGIFFVDVIVRRPSIGERLIAGLLYDGASPVPAHAFNPTGLSEQQRRQSSLQMMERSQQVAAAVALREAGYEVEARSNGAFVSQVLPGSPAAGKLRPSDVIVRIDTATVRTLAQLRAALERKRPGDPVTVHARRAGRPVEARIELTADPADADRAVMGVLVQESTSIRLPVDVEIRTGSVGGPSAGLALALGLLAKLGRDVDHGRRVAVTGELHLDGSVSSVGGIKQKTIGAREAGIDVFLVPAGDNAQEARRHAQGMRVVPVRSFQQALRALATASD